MMAGSEVEKKLQGALARAFQALGGPRVDFQAGVAALSRAMGDMLLETPPCGFAENPHAACTRTCEVGRRNALLDVLDLLRRAPSDEPFSVRGLNDALSRAWVDLMARYESHQLRLVGALWRYLQDEEMVPWLSKPVDRKVARSRMAISCDTEYPSDDMECQLRFQAMVWFIVAALKSTYQSEEEQGWRHLESAFLIAEAFRRGHLAQSAGAALETAEAEARNNPRDQAMWAAFKRHHDAWFARWWAIFGPLHAWLSQEMGMCPSRLENVFRVLGDNAWDLPLGELLHKAERLLG